MAYPTIEAPGTDPNNACAVIFAHQPGLGVDNVATVKSDAVTNAVAELEASGWVIDQVSIYTCGGTPPPYQPPENASPPPQPEPPSTGQPPETQPPPDQIPVGTGGGDGDEIIILIQVIYAQLQIVVQTLEQCCPGHQQGGGTTDPACCDKLAAALAAIATGLGAIAKAIATAPGGGGTDLATLIETLHQLFDGLTGAIEGIGKSLAREAGPFENPVLVPPKAPETQPPTPASVQHDAEQFIQLFAGGPQ